MTPDADVISTAEPETDEWFKVRRGGITATDLPKILGYSRYGNALTVWHDKAGNLPPEPGGPAAEWGHLLEDVVAQKFARDHGIIVARVGILANSERPWMLAALDRLCDTCPDGDGPCWLEVKCRSAFKAGSFREDVPDDVLAQVGWQRMVSGLSHGHIAVLIGGNDLRTFRYDADPDVEALLLAEAEMVWRCIEDGVPPEVDATTALLDMFDRLYPNRDGATEIGRATYVALKDDYDRACAVAKVAEGGKDWAAYRLLELLGAGDRAVATDDPTAVLATYKPTMRGRATDALLADLEPYPEARKVAAKKYPTKPSLTWKKAF